jgi:TatD DNase family protein
MGEHERSRQLAQRLPGCLLGFGIHPQGIRDDTAEFLASLAREGRIDFIGEAGFDFFGDRPERVRTPKTLAAQKKAFEFQLNLAVGCGLPLVIHARKGLDLLLAYTKPLARLPSVVFHGWPGRAVEAKIFIDRGVAAYFSFGTPLLRGAKHAEESIAYLGPDRLLSETDAPWQPSLGQPWTALSALDPIAARIAQLKGLPRQEMDHWLRRNFLQAFLPGEKN